MYDVLTGAHKLDEAPVVAHTVPISSFTRADGTMDMEALLEAAEGGWRPETDAVLGVSTSYVQLVTRFLLRRIEEAGIWEATGCLPDNVAYNQQAWWRLDLWLMWIHARDERAASKSGKS